MSINLYLGGFVGTDGGWPWAHAYSIYAKLSELANSRSPGPAGTFVFLDMREDRVNWGNFMIMMTGYPDKPQLYSFNGDLPGMYHNLACGFSFADGHSEIKRWRDPRTTPPLVRDAIGPMTDNASPNNKDIAWLQERSTRPR